MHHYIPKKIAFHLGSHRRRGLLGRLGLILNDSGLKQEEITTFSILFQYGTTASFTLPCHGRRRFAIDKEPHRHSPLPESQASVHLLFGFSLVFILLAWPHSVLELTFVGQAALELSVLLTQPPNDALS